MNKVVWDLGMMESYAGTEVEMYNKDDRANDRIERVLMDSIRERLEALELSQKSAQERFNEKKSKIYANYSSYDIEQGRFTRADAKLLKEIFEEERKSNEYYRNRIESLKRGKTEISRVLGDIRELEEQSLMFGYPRPPMIQSREDVDNRLKFNDVGDRARSYQHQQEFARNLVVLAELMGTKVSKDILSLLDRQMSGVVSQSSSAIASKKENLNDLLKQYGLTTTHVKEYRFTDQELEEMRQHGGKVPEAPTAEMAVSSFARNSNEILRLATHNMVHSFLEWPEDDKRALKEKTKEPSYSNQVCQVIDNLIELIGGIEGMDAPADLIAKLQKMKAPYAKIVSKQDTEQRKQFQQEIENRSGESVKNTDSPAAAQEPISYEARYYFEMWRQSGTGLEFMDWCVEEKHLPYDELKKITGVDQLFKEWDEGVRQYNEQQRKIAEAKKDEISPEARHYFEMWRQSGTGLEFMDWCVEEKHLPYDELKKITGVDQLFKEWDEGVRKYNEDKAKEAETLVGTIDPRAVAYYNEYSKSGSPLEFVKWCDENGLEVPRGWEKIQEERFAGMKEYQKQQAEAVIDDTVVDPMAYGYYDAYSKSKSPKGFVAWCDEKGLNVPRGWQNVEKQYQSQQAEMDDDVMGM